MMGDSKKEKANGKAKPTASDSNSDTEDVVPWMKKVISKLEDLTKKVDDNSLKCQENFRSSEFVQNGISDKLETIVADFETLKSDFKEVKKENIALRESVKSLSEKVKDYDMKFEFLERQRKKSNICIEGVLEIANLPLEKLMDELLDDLNLKFKAQDVCNKIFRKGKYVAPSAGNMPKPRPIVVQLYDESFKYEIFKNVKNIVGNDKWKNVYINEELTADQTNKMKMMRAISGFAKSVGMETRIKGTSLICEDKKYGLDDLLNVPEKISIENAKTIEYNNIVVFQSHHSYLSNMSKSEFSYEGRKFYSAETAFQSKKAEMCNHKEESKAVQKMQDSYQAKRACQNLKETNEWKQKKDKVMKEILDAKFSQNAELKKKIVETKNLVLIEGTTDKYWGSGIPIAKYKSIDHKNMPGKNTLGQMLMDLRKKMSKK